MIANVTFVPTVRAWDGYSVAFRVSFRMQPPCVIPPLAPLKIVRRVAERNGLTLDEIRSQSRAPAIAHPRQEAMWELRQRTKLSLPQIARVLGLKDHTTVIHGLRAYERRLALGAST